MNPADSHTHSRSRLLGVGRVCWLPTLQTEWREARLPMMVFGLIATNLITDSQTGNFVSHVHCDSSCATSVVV
jgi:hypothetical protein